METKHIFNYIIGFVLLFGCEANISDQRLCGDPTCSEPVSYATTLLKYSSDDIRILSFPANAKVKVYSKSAGTRMDLWGIEINGRRGYAPKGFLRENRILKSKLDHFVLTETEDEYDTPEETQGSPETQVVDGTTFFFDQSASSADQTNSLGVPKPLSEPTAPLTTPEPSSLGTLVPSVVESQPPIHSTEVPVIPDPSVSTKVHSSLSESFSELKSEPSSVDPTVAFSGSDLGAVDHPTPSVSNPGFVEPSSLNSQSDPTEPTLIHMDVPAQPITTERVDTPLESGEPTLIKAEIPSPTDDPFLDVPPPSVEVPESSHEDEEEDDDDDDDYFDDEEEEEGNTKGIYQYISSFLPGDGNPVKEEEIAEYVKKDESNKFGDSSEEEIGKGALAPEVLPAIDNETPINSDIPYLDSGSIPDNTHSPVVVDTSSHNSVSPVNSDIPSKSFDSSVLVENLSTYDDVHKLADSTENTGSSEQSYSETTEHSVLSGLSSEATKIPFLFESSEANNPSGLFEQTSESLGSLGLDEKSSEANDPSNLVESTLDANDPSDLVEPSSDATNPSDLVEPSSDATDPSDLVGPTSEAPMSENWGTDSPEVIHQDSVTVPLDEFVESLPDPPAEVVENGGSQTNETEELSKKEAVPDNLAFFKKSSIHSPNEDLDESNEKLTEDPSPSFFSLVSNYLSGIAYPFAKLESGVEGVGASLEPFIEEGKEEVGETCSHDGSAGNCDSAARAPAESADEYPYETDSPKGFFEETDSDTLHYLIVTAATVLLFTLGHYFIENLRHDAKYIAVINDLQKQLSVSAAEVTCVKAELESIQESNTAAKHDNVEAEELRERLNESQNVCVDLEDQVACLQSELETATETGLELNRMLSEYLATQQDSENDPLKSKVEDLQIQLNSQQGTILSMNELLLAKDSEIESLVEELLGVKTEAAELISIRKELVELANQAEEREASLIQVKRDLIIRDKEISVAQECITQMSATAPGQEDLQVLRDILDVARVQADLQIVTEERDLLRSQFEEEVNSRKMLEDHRSVIEEQITMLQEACRSALSEKTEAKTKLEVLSNYFKEKEDQHQKELVSREAACVRDANEQSGDEISSLKEQINIYKTQNDALTREILDQERDFKDQIASLELKAHENWVAARQAERRSEELKHDAATLRNLLTIAEKQSIKQLGDRLPSPLHAAMPDCPPVAVMPPCLFPAPGSPHDRRPPPLGCMSSPPLLPPARYHHGFRPLSAPKGSNHSSGHSSGSIEKYNNQV